MSPNSPATCNRAKVMSARSLMRPLPATAEHGGTVDAGRQDRELRAPRSSRRASPSPWSTAPAQPVGEMTPDAVIDLLAGREQAERRAMSDVALSATPSRQRRCSSGWPIWAIALLAVAAALSCAATAFPGRPTIPTTPIIPVRRMDRRVHDLAQDQLHLADARSSPPSSTCRCKLAFALLAKGFKIGIGAGGDRCCRACPGSASSPPLASLGHALGGMRLALLARPRLPLHRAVRPMGQRHADAGADLICRAVLRRHRAAARHLGLSHAAGRTAGRSRRRST